jgi:hypothetical protein
MRPIVLRELCVSWWEWLASMIKESLDIDYATHFIKIENKQMKLSSAEIIDKERTQKSTKLIEDVINKVRHRLTKGGVGAARRHPFAGAFSVA